MAFRPLPPIQVQSTLDQSGFNAGHYTTAFSTTVLQGLNMPYFELYHAVASSVPAGASATIGFAPGMTWGFTAPGVGGGAEYHLGGSGWILTPGREFYFFWNTGTGTKPLVTAWFRYDPAEPANRVNLSPNDPARRRL